MKLKRCSVLIVAALLSTGLTPALSAVHPVQAPVQNPEQPAEAVEVSFVCADGIPCGTVLSAACALIPESLRDKYHLCEFG